MIEGHHFQNAYVTRSVDKAVEKFRRHAKVDREMVFTTPSRAWTPQGEGELVNRLAFLWVGDMQYELIEPISGYVDLYRDALPDDDSLVFHHSCTRIPDWDDFRARVDAQPFPVVLEGGGELLRYVYLDARPLLGHYLEYVWMVDERWTQLGGI